MEVDSRYEGATIFRLFMKACPLSYCSFRNQKIPIRCCVRFVPELMGFEHLFNPRALESWKDEMSIYNRMVMRGIRMRLCPRSYSNSLITNTLDDYIRRHRNAELASALTLLCRFALRIMARIRRKPGAPFWSVSGAIVITRQSWQEFCADMAVLAGRVAADCAAESCTASPTAKEAKATAATALHSDRRPDLPALRAAAARAAELADKAACI